MAVGRVDEGHPDPPQLVGDPLAVAAGATATGQPEPCSSRSAVPPDATRPKAPPRWEPTTTMAASSSSASSASPRAGEPDGTVRYSAAASSASASAPPPVPWRRARARRRRRRWSACPRGRRRPRSAGRRWPGPGGSPAPPRQGPNRSRRRRPRSVRHGRSLPSVVVRWGGSASGTRDRGSPRRPAGRARAARRPGLPGHAGLGGHLGQRVAPAEQEPADQRPQQDDGDDEVDDLGQRGAQSPLISPLLSWRAVAAGARPGGRG